MAPYVRITINQIISVINMSDFYIFIVIYGGMHIIPSFTIKFLG